MNTDDLLWQKAVEVVDEVCNAVMGVIQPLPCHIEAFVDRENLEFRCLQCFPRRDLRKVMEDIGILVDRMMQHYHESWNYTYTSGCSIRVFSGWWFRFPYNPTTPLSLAFRFSALTMREIGLVITPLDPGHEGQALLNRIYMQGQHDFE
jgi:hypothetical protein